MDDDPTRAEDEAFLIRRASGEGIRIPIEDALPYREKYAGAVPGQLTSKEFERRRRLNLASIEILGASIEADRKIIRTPTLQQVRRAERSDIVAGAVVWLGLDAGSPRNVIVDGLGGTTAAYFFDEDRGVHLISDGWVEL